MPQQDLRLAFDPRRADVSTIVSILPVPVDESKPGLLPAQYIIPSVKNPLEDVEVLHVYRAHFPVYLDENRPALIVPAPSDTVAEAFCRDYKGSMQEYTPGIAEPGLFWTKGYVEKNDVKTQLPLELDEARSMQLQWFKRLVDVADDDWGKYHIRRMISTIHRLACNTLKLEREWNSDLVIEKNLAMKPCKFCRADLHPEAIICQYCRGIIDMVKYQAEYHSADQAPTESK
jgi:hypothetical protein